MLERFIANVSQQHLFPTGQEVLLAVSGGMDSVTLMDLMSRGGFGFGIAHCNFHLRPIECDRDEMFVRQLAEKYGARCHVTQFETTEYAKSRHLSIEEAARELRYEYFEQLRKEYGYGAIATAHHRDDVAETFFINLMRGTGLAGLHGILPVQGYVVRPLLPFGRDEIAEYCKKNGLRHVEDSTNASLNYRRNQVRHVLMPTMREIEAGADAAIERTIGNLRSTEKLYKALLKPVVEQLTHIEEDGTVRIKIDFADILASNEEATLKEQLLFELLHPYGFNSATIKTIANNSRSGSQYISPTHRAVMNRDEILLVAIAKNDVAEMMPTLKIERMEAGAEMPDPRKLPITEIMIDAETVREPLTLRHWKSGDRFQPLGMKRGTQLVSDYFSDHKLSQLEKEQQLIMTDANDKIVWIVGRRTSHIHRITPETRKVLLIQLIADQSIGDSPC